VSKGTVSLMLNVKKKEQEFNVNAFKSKLPKKSRFKLKWKTIQWLVENKKDTILQLCSNYQLLIKLCRTKTNGVSKEDFIDLLTYVGLGGEKGLGDKLFYVFDDDGNGEIDYKELIMGLEIFRDTTYEEKIRIFFELCDLQNTGHITRKELYDVLKRNMITEDDKIKLKKTISGMFAPYESAKTGRMDKKELFSVTLRNSELRNLLEECMRTVRTVDRIIDNDLEEPFHSIMPSAGNMQQQEGCHFPLNRKVLDMIKTNEHLRFEAKIKKQEIMEEAKKIQKSEGQNFEQSDSDS